MTEQHWRKRETKLTMVDIDAIHVVNRILYPSKARIAAMAKGLTDLGQLYPILITKHLRAWRVVAGATRLLAAKELGWDQIETIIIGADNEYDYRLIEIEENLNRNDLTASERKRLKELNRTVRAERVEHFKKLAKGEITDDAPVKKAKGGRGKKGGIADAARKAGVARSTARDQIKKKAGGKANPPALADTLPQEPKRPKAPAPEPVASSSNDVVRLTCPNCDGRGWVAADADEASASPDAIVTRH
jgi:hypothetical protein